MVYTDTTLVEYAHTPRDITGSVSVPQYERCSLIVVFSNAVGNSEPFETTLGKVNVCMCLCNSNTF